MVQGAPRSMGYLKCIGPCGRPLLSDACSPVQNLPVRDPVEAIHHVPTSLFLLHYPIFQGISVSLYILNLLWAQTLNSRHLFRRQIILLANLLR